MSCELHYGKPAGSQCGWDAKSEREKSERETALTLAIGLTMILLLSLGLWWVVLSVIWPLASVLLEQGASLQARSERGITPLLGENSPGLIVPGSLGTPSIAEGLVG